VSANQRYALKSAATLAELITDIINLGGHKAAVAGSIRRRAKNVGDIDLVVQANNLAGVTLPDWLTVVRGGKDYRRYATDRYGDAGLCVDIWRCPSDDAWGGFMLFATGTADYNVFMRRQANQRGFKLNQHGLWRGVKHLPLREDEISLVLGLPHLTPEARNRWESNIKPTKRKATV